MAVQAEKKYKIISGQTKHMRQLVDNILSNLEHVSRQKIVLTMCDPVCPTMANYFLPCDSRSTSSKLTRKRVSWLL